MAVHCVLHMCNLLQGKDPAWSPRGAPAQELNPMDVYPPELGGTPSKAAAPHAYAKYQDDVFEDDHDDENEMMI
jgi:hypothetical protein